MQDYENVEFPVNRVHLLSVPLRVAGGIQVPRRRIAGSTGLIQFERR